MPSKMRILGKDGRRIVGADKEDVQRQPGFFRDELALCASEVESSERLVDVHRPTASPNDPWDWYAPSMGVKMIAALAADHAVGRTTPIELRPTFAESKQGALAG